MTVPEPLQQIDRTYVRWRGRKLSYFAGCDYFRLASHPKVLGALQTGLKNFGLNVAASRMTTGNHALYGELENSLAKFFGSESATLVANGYATNLIVAQALVDDFTHVFIDEKAHPSLQDAAKIFTGAVKIFKHRDAKNLSIALRKLKKNSKPILLTDGMFSSDGSIAPLKNYLKFLPENGMLLVDDAHGTGVLGKSGKGTIEWENISRERVIQTVTLSKAFGVYGGAILGNADLREKIFSKSGMFVGSTPLPLPLANAAMASVKILASDKKFRRRLAQNVDYVKSALRKFEWPISENESPIISIVPENNSEADALKKRCQVNGVFPSWIKYPGGPESGYFRFVISSEHSQKQLDALLKALV